MYMHGLIITDVFLRVSMREPKKRKIDTQDQQSPSVVSAMEEAINSSPPSKPKKKKKSKEDHRGLECENPSSLMFVEPLTETPVVEKKHKKKKQVDSEPTPESAKVVEKQEEMKRAVKELSPEIETEPTVDEATTELDSTNKEPSEEESAKRKRRRRRRKSQYKSPFEAADGSLPQPFEILPDYVPPAPKSAIHVRFDADSGNDTEPIVGHADAGTNGFGIRNQPESNGTYKTNHANLENAKTKGSKNNSKPAVYQSPSAASTPVPQLNALLSLRSAVFSRSSNDQASIQPSYNNVPPPQALTSSKVLSSPKVPASLPFKQEPIKLDPTTFPIIKGLPRVNDLIAFKVNLFFYLFWEANLLKCLFFQVLEISENYTPEISDYMQGRITCMSPGSDITVELLSTNNSFFSV